MRLDRRRADDGFTAIELVISMALLGLIIVPISLAFYTSFLEADATRDRIADSATAQVTSSFLLSDVQSSQRVYTSNVGGCLPSPFSAAAGDVVELQFMWVHPDPSIGAAQTTHVSYVNRAPRTGEVQHELHRAMCTTGGAPATEPIKLTPYLDDGANAFVPQLLCGGTTCPPAELETPDEVLVDIVTRSKDPGSDSSYSSYTIAFAALRRVG